MTFHRAGPGGGAAQRAGLILIGRNAQADHVGRTTLAQIGVHEFGVRPPAAESGRFIACAFGPTPWFYERGPKTLKITVNFKSEKKSMKQNTAMAQAITLLGGRGRTANLLNANEILVGRWVAGSAAIPRETALQIEKLTDGKISAPLLAPQENWSGQEHGRLPYEIGRCAGFHPAVGDCAIRDTCWRYTARVDVGPQTAVYGHLCVEEGDQRIAFLGAS